MESIGKLEQFYVISFKVYKTPQLCILLFSYSVFLSSIAGVMFSDYYIVRKGYFSVPYLYTADSDGPYWYLAGFNPKAYVPPSLRNHFLTTDCIYFWDSCQRCGIRWRGR